MPNILSSIIVDTVALTATVNNKNAKLINWYFSEILYNVGLTIAY